MASKDTITKIMRILCENWPREPMTPERVGLYHRLLEDIPNEVLEAAALHCIATETFFPTIAALRNAAFGMVPAIDGLPTAGEAWAEVLREINRTGAMMYKGPPQFSTPAIAQAIRAFGWRDLCLSENAVADRAHFMRVYEQITRRAVDAIKVLPQVRQVTAALTAGTVKMLAQDRAPGDNPAMLPDGEVAP